MWNNCCIFAVDSVIWGRNEPPPMEESTLKKSILKAWQSHCRRPRIVGKFVTQHKGGICFPFLVIMLMAVDSAVLGYYYDLLKPMFGLGLIHLYALLDSLPRMFTMLLINDNHIRAFVSAMP